MNTYTLDLSLRPSTFDLWHFCLASSVLVLALLLIIVLFAALFSARRQPSNQATAPAPEIKIVEKVVEVEKIVPGPAPEPIVLKQATSDAALQLLSLLQKEAHFIDFINENVNAYSDNDIGAAARIVHQGCAKVINNYFQIKAIAQEPEGQKITLNKGFDANAYRLTGNIVGQAPFTGLLVHKGWQATDVSLPKLTESHNANIIAAAEVEL